MQGKVIRLVPAVVSRDTIQAVENLRRDIEDGRLVGFAYIAMYRIDDYIVDATGTCKLLPHVTRGFLATLDDELAKLEPEQA